MSQVLIFIIGLVVGGLIVWLRIRHRVSSRGGLTKMNLERQKGVEESKARILEVLNKKSRIANDDVEAILGVSDATAFRYLEELEQEGKITQVGTKGRSVFYKRK